MKAASSNMLKALLFLIFLMAVFWGLSMLKQILSGKMSTKRLITYIVGFAVLIVGFVFVLLPVIR